MFASIEYGWRRITFRIAAIIVGAMGGIVLSETGLRILMSPSTTYRALSPGLEKRFNPQFLPGVNGPSVFKINSMGVRGREWSTDRAREFRILCMGGSATENLFTDQNRVWTTLLEQRLGTWRDGRQVWTGNIGRAGLSSQHHVLQMRRLLDVYDPDLVIMLVGGNDLYGWLRRGGDGQAYPSESEQRSMERAFAVQPGLFDGHRADAPWFKQTRIWTLARRLKEQIVSLTEFQDNEGRSLQRWRQMRATGRRSSVLPPIEAGLQGYRRNLEQIVYLARDHGVPLILMTQPSLYRPGLNEQERNLLWLAGVGDFRRIPHSVYYEPEAVAKGMDAFNSTLLRVCRDRSVHCVDLAAVIPKTTEYFYDDLHFTDKAQVLIAEVVALAVLSPPTNSTALGAAASSEDRSWTSASVQNE